jgi:hypothetical protein
MEETPMRRSGSSFAAIISAILVAWIYGPGDAAATIWDDSTKAESKIPETTGDLPNDLESLDFFGISVSGLGDLDGDGVNDLAVGSTVERNQEKGEARVLFMTPEGTVDDEEVIDEATLGVTFGRFEQFGASIANLGDFDGDGVIDLAVGAPGNSDGGVPGGAVWLLFMNADGSVSHSQKISQTEGNFEGVLDPQGEFGFSVTSIGDLDADGVIDLAVGAHRDSDGALQAGAVWILFLNAEGTVRQSKKISNSSGDLPSGMLGRASWFGESVAGLGDLDRDGFPDLAVGSPGGVAVWILFLNEDGTVKDHQIVGRQRVGDGGGFGGAIDGQPFFGASVANVGDLDGDGVIDLVVGAPLEDDGVSFQDHGTIWVLLMNTDGTVKAEHKISHNEGGFSGTLVARANFGRSVTSLGDLDGDGMIDLAVGAPGTDDGNGEVATGAVWALSLTPLGRGYTLVKRGATWRYWDQVTEPSGWQSPDFDDSHWGVASASRLGWEEDLPEELPDECFQCSATGELPDGFEAGRTTYYFRHEFDVADPVAISSEFDRLLLELMRDDGAVVYLNGQEIWRTNMPDGPITDQTPATETLNGAVETAFFSTAISPDLLNRGRNVLAVEVHQALPANPDDLHFDLRLLASREPILVERGAEWRYCDGGSEPPGWNTPDFNGACPTGSGSRAWEVAHAPLGFDTNETSPLEAGHIAYYFRHDFQVADPSTFTGLLLEVMRDDGAVVYLNGQEVWRTNMPDGTITDRTEATARVGCLAPPQNCDSSSFFSTMIPPDELVAGTNVVAVEVHQTRLPSSDLNFDLRLLASSVTSLVGAGDIAVAGPSGPSEGATAVAALLDELPGGLFTTGDNAQGGYSPSEIIDNYTEGFDPTWGRHKMRLCPSPGNHDYESDTASPFVEYFKYFSDDASPQCEVGGEDGKGYYSYDIDNWHIIVLNGCELAAADKAPFCSDANAGFSEDQLAWLESDLADAASTCTLAYWHHPRFSSGGHGEDGISNEPIKNAWDLLYDFGAEIVINSHDHHYERFVPLNPGLIDETELEKDQSFGIRQFITGTGGYEVRKAAPPRYPGSSRIIDFQDLGSDRFGVLRLTLGQAWYDWQFIADDGGEYDRGGGRCHDAPPPG